MNSGGTPRSLSRARRPLRAVLLLAAVATCLSACSAGGSDGSSGADPSPTLVAPDGSTPAPEGGDAAPQAPMEGKTVACSDLDPSAWSAAPTEIDLPTKIGAGEAPVLGVTAPPDQAVLFPTPDDFLAQSNVDDPIVRKAIMEESGYRGGIKAEWASNNGFTMQVLNFADAPAAARYVEARLPGVCAQGGTQAGVTMLNDGDGITWTDPLGATHGEFIFGGSQVSFTTCGGCEAVSLGSMQAWHDAFLEAYASGPATPIS